jgi:hypothetical protein
MVPTSTPTASPPPRIAVVTGQQVADPTRGDRALIATLRDRGWSAEPTAWSDGAVDWSAFDAVLVRSCWRYHARPGSFLDWVATVETADAALLTPADGIRWNTHESYLRELEREGVPILRTTWVERSREVDLRTLLARNDWARAVVRPAVRTSSDDAWRTSLVEAPAHQRRFDAFLADSGALVQAFPPGRADGERSLVFFGGAFSHATRRSSTADDANTRPHDATTVPYDPPGEIVERAAEALETACGVVGIRPMALPQARVAGIERDGAFLLTDLHLVEPTLHLDAASGALDTFADAIESAIERSTTDTVRSAAPSRRSIDR